MKKNDKFWAVHMKPTMAACGILLLALSLQIANLHDAKKIKEFEKQQNSKLAKVDSQIKSKNAQIDSLYGVADSLVADSLARHPEYSWVVNNKDKTDSLRTVNQNYINQAYNAAKNHSIMTLAYRNESVFRDFADVPVVKNLKWKYCGNKKKIQEFDRRAPFVQHVPDAVRAHFDNKTNAQVRVLQQQIDSLLNEKRQLIR